MATPRAAVLGVPARRAAWRRSAFVLAGAVGIALVPGAASADEPSTASEAAALVAARGHELEVITEEFNEAREVLRAQQAAAETAAAAVADAQAAVTGAQEQVRGIARSAFTGDSMGSLQALMTSGSADEFVNRITLLETVAGHQNVLLGRAVAAGEAAAQARTAADEAAAQAQAQYDAVAAQQADLEAQIAAYQADYARLSADERRAALAAAATAHGDAESSRASRADRTESAPAPAAPATSPAPAVPATSPAPAPAPVAASGSAIQTAINTAMAQRGKPYVWAASGPGSYDCSGLVQYAFRAAGISLPHSSRMQSATGTPVSRAEARPGDLVAFYSPVSHIGIYIGNGQMVHAPTSGDVVKVASVDTMGTAPKFNRIG
ncbi:C40 family peptidase [Geodermatophilus ruber]|uniref:Cell wall-associated hydrolase, NlpC family n=1 Tax=Geodermatophilus ruber TaxID=504800 RepID=A0A1I3Z934_9ACTN|nr:C40 family peptidase [Geodermatophilus ruber]SFK40562.1 Cell wall-associated hydrolase, NlpC family [Geodermatophilus ruber]